MAQWVQNSTAAAWVAAEVGVRSLAQRSGLKDVAWIHSLAWELPYAMGVDIKGKRKSFY